MIRLISLVGVNANLSSIFTPTGNNTSLSFIPTGNKDLVTPTLTKNNFILI